MKGGKGKVFRPCKQCGESINFVPWAEERHRGNIWHWANADGSHHVCAIDSQEARHINSILREGLS